MSEETKQLSELLDQGNYCEDCEVLIEPGTDDLCEECSTNNYCECGQRLEDAHGSPGDGFCTRCR